MSKKVHVDRRAAGKRKLALEIRGGQGESLLEVFAAGEDEPELRHRVPVAEVTELQLDDELYVARISAPGRAHQYALLDLRDVPRLEHRIEMHARSEHDDAMHEVIEDVRARKELQAWLHANAPWLLLAFAYAKHGEAIGGAASRDAKGRPAIEELPGGTKVIRGTKGIIVLTTEFGAHAISGPIYEKWSALQAESLAASGQPWGYPMAAERDAEGGGGRCQSFRRPGVHARFSAAIYWKQGIGAWSVGYPFYVHWQQLGASAGALGFPTTDLQQFDFGASRAARQRFEHGILYRNPRVGDRVYALHGALHAAFVARGGEGVLGLPTSEAIADGGATLGHFRMPSGWDGTLVLRGGAVHWLSGVIRDRWLGDRRAAYGWPLGSIEIVSRLHWVEFEHYRVSWNGLAADHPELAYEEHPKNVPQPTSQPFMQHVLNLVPAGEDKATYAATILGRYQALRWPGIVAGHSGQTLLVGNIAGLDEATAQNSATLQAGATLSGADFTRIFGTGTSVTIFAQPSTPPGVDLTRVPSIGIGLQPIG